MSRGPQGSAPHIIAFAIVLLMASPLAAQHAPPPDILVTRQLAEAEGLSIGSVVRLATTADGADATAFRIAGIYEPTPDPSRLGTVPRQVRLHLPDLLALTRPSDTPSGTEHVETINVALGDPGEAAGFAREFSSAHARGDRGERGRGDRRRRVPRARAISPRDRRRHDRRRNRVPPRADDHARGRAPRDRRRAAPHRPARAPHPGADLPRGRADCQRRDRCSGSRSPPRRRSSSTGSSSGATTRR